MAEAGSRNACTKGSGEEMNFENNQEQFEEMELFRGNFTGIGKQDVEESLKILLFASRVHKPQFGLCHPINL